MSRPVNSVPAVALPPTIVVPIVTAVNADGSAAMVDGVVGAPLTDPGLGACFLGGGGACFFVEA